jgi:hypothetical protein
MGVKDIYRDRASLGHLPVLRGQTLIETPYRLQVDANTVGLWWFDATDKASGVYVFDRATTPHLGTLVNTPTWGTTGPWSSDLGFDGAQREKVAIASGLNLGSSSFTAEVVFKSATIPDTAGYDTIYLHPIVGRGPSHADKYWWNFSLSGHRRGVKIGCLEFNAKAAAEVTFYSTAARVDDSNYHYAAVTLTRGSNAGAMYLDGADAGTSADIGCGAGAMDTNAFSFGQSESGNELSYYGDLNGSIALVRISTVVRSAGEILTNAKLMGFA